MCQTKHFDEAWTGCYVAVKPDEKQRWHVVAESSWFDARHMVGVKLDSAPVDLNCRVSSRGCCAVFVGRARLLTALALRVEALCSP